MRIDRVGLFAIDGLGAAQVHTERRGARLAKNGTGQRRGTIGPKTQEKGFDFEVRGVQHQETGAWPVGAS